MATNPILTGITVQPAAELLPLLSTKKELILIDPMPYDDTGTDACSIVLVREGQVYFTIISPADDGFSRMQVCKQEAEAIQEQLSKAYVEGAWLATIENPIVPYMDTETLLALLQSQLYQNQTRCINEVRQLLAKPAPFDPFQL